MNMACMSKPAYYQHLDVIMNVLEKEDEEMRNDRHRLRECLLKENNCGEEDSVPNAAVSFNGTLAKG